MTLEKICRERIGEQMEVTADGTFSWVEVECLGACVNAPMAQINVDYYEDLDAGSFNKVLDEFAAGKKPKPGPQIDRQLSAPVGGATTLHNGGGGASSSRRRRKNQKTTMPRSRAKRPISATPARHSHRRKTKRTRNRIDHAR